VKHTSLYILITLSIKGQNNLPPSLIQAPAREVVEEKIAMLKEVGIGGVYALGNTSESLCQIPVARIDIIA